MNSSGRTCVIGIGNVLLMDEGVGPEVARRLLSRFVFPPEVEVRDCATMGMAMLGLFRDFDHIVAVDAVDGTGEPPGTVFRFDPSDIAARTTPPSAHDMRFSDVMAAAGMLGYEARGHCIGIQVENMSPAEFCMGLTPAVEAAVPLAMETVLAVLHELGIRGIEPRDAADGEEALASTMAADAVGEPRDAQSPGDGEGGARRDGNTI